MTFGNGADLSATRSAPAFDFGLVPSSQRPGSSQSGDPRRNRRRRPGIDRAVLATAAVVVFLSVVAVTVAGLVAWTLVQSSETRVKEDSALFCADLATTPGVLEQPGFGWPTDSADIPTTAAAMQVYQQRWAALAEISPPTIRTDVAAVATAASTVLAQVESSQSLNRQGNLASIDAVTKQTAIPALSLIHI